MGHPRFLINESPLITLPTLAQAIGLHEAIVLQQLHSQLGTGEVYGGRRYVRNSYPEWQKKFPFWTERQVRIAFKSLREQSLIIVDQFNTRSGDRTNWYTIDYDAVRVLEVQEGDETNV